MDPALNAISKERLSKTQAQPRDIDAIPVLILGITRGEHLAIIGFDNTRTKKEIKQILTDFLNDVDGADYIPL